MTTIYKKKFFPWTLEERCVITSRAHTALQILSKIEEVPRDIRSAQLENISKSTHTICLVYKYMSCNRRSPKQCNIKFEQLAKAVELNLQFDLRNQKLRTFNYMYAYRWFYKKGRHFHSVELVNEKSTFTAGIRKISDGRGETYMYAYCASEEVSFGNRDAVFGKVTNSMTDISATEQKVKNLLKPEIRTSHYHLDHAYDA